MELPPGGVETFWAALPLGCHERPQIIDLGCGNGALALSLAQMGADVLAVDNNPHQLGTLTALQIVTGNAPIRLLMADITQPNQFPKAQFCGVVAHNSLHMISGNKLPRAIETILRVAHNGALLWIADVQTTVQHIGPLLAGWERTLPLRSPKEGVFYIKTGLRDDGQRDVRP
jgi:SAM-dependent methyltransferase